MQSVYYSTICGTQAIYLLLKRAGQEAVQLCPEWTPVENVSSVSGGKKLAQGKTDSKQPGQQVR